MIYTLVTALCLIVLIAEVCSVMWRFARGNRPERITFLRSFKKGKCIIIFLTSIPLYCAGHLYAGQDFLHAFFLAIHKIANLVMLKYDVSSIDALMQAHTLYRGTIWFCFILVGLNAMILTLSFFAQSLWSWTENWRTSHTKRERLFLFGANSKNIDICKSDKTHRKLMVGPFTSADCETMYFERIPYLVSRSYDRPLEKLLKQSTKNNSCTLILNTGDDAKNISLCRAVINHLRGLSDKDKQTLFLHLRVYVFADPRFDTIYADIATDGFGCIHVVNKYQKIAVDFIDRYPFAAFLGAKQVDFTTSLIRPNVDINCLLIGFGKTNQQLFLTSVANNQFLTAGEKGAPVLKPVTYHIFDRESSVENKNLNHSYYRYLHERAQMQAQQAQAKADRKPPIYLPLPELPAQEVYYPLDINDRAFYQQIHEIVTRGAQDVNFVIIAFGSDLENMDMAQKLVEKRREWNLENLILFVKVRAWHKHDTLLEDEDCYFIAHEGDVVYHLDKIKHDRLSRMAEKRNETYDLERALSSKTPPVTDADIAACRASSQYRWYVTRSQMERESNLYAMLSLRSKLLLMGLDYVPADADGEALGEAEYLAAYAGTDLPDITTNPLRVDGKPIVTYTLDFAESRRKTMAIHEHERWNSFAVSKGMIPASIQQILKEEILVGEQQEHTNGKRYDLRRHGNLTTFEGLVTFRQMVSRRDSKDERETDVIKYDYQLLDDAYWLVATGGYKIVRRTDI